MVTLPKFTHLDYAHMCARDGHVPSLAKCGKTLANGRWWACPEKAFFVWTEGVEICPDALAVIPDRFTRPILAPRPWSYN